MKKSVVILFALLAVLSASCFAACDTESQADEHTHSFTEYVYQNDATCLQDGTETAKCDSCDETDTRVKENSALGHDLIPHEGKAATCTESGWAAYETCSHCDYTTYRELAALDHELIPHEGKAATCTEIGWAAYETCSRCDYTTYREIEKLDHEYVFSHEIPGTCIQPGEMVYICRNCGGSTTEAGAYGFHDWGGERVVKEPTTQQNGEILFACRVCEEKMRLLLPALSQKAVDEGAYRREPIDPDGACGEPGGVRYIFTFRTQTDEIFTFSFDLMTAAQDHILNGKPLSEWADPDRENAVAYDIPGITVVENFEQTCLALGGGAFLCERCGEFIYVQVYYPHRMGSYSSRRDASCTQPGLQTGTCSVCGVWFEEAIPATGHDYSGYTLVEEGDGSLTLHLSCRSCGHEEQVYHVTVDEDASSPSTCHSIGVTVFRWTDAAGEHTLSLEEEVAPHVLNGEPVSLDAYFSPDTPGLIVSGNAPVTCREYGRGVFTCETCKEMYLVQVRGPHQFGEAEIVQPTCTRAGAERRYCILCNAVSETILQSALGHDYVKQEGKQATCEQAGWEPYEICTRCGDSTQRKYYAPHRYVKGVCAVCGRYKSVCEDGYHVLKDIDGNDVLVSIDYTMYLGVEEYPGIVLLREESYDCRMKVLDIGAFRCAHCKNLILISICGAHEYDESTKVSHPATCSAPAYITVDCKYCGPDTVLSVGSELDAEAHIYGDTPQVVTEEDGTTTLIYVCTLDDSHRLVISDVEIVSDRTSYPAGEASCEAEGERVIVYVDGNGNEYTVRMKIPKTAHRIGGTSLTVTDEETDNHIFTPFDERAAYVTALDNMPVSCEETSFGILYCDICGKHYMVKYQGAHQETQLIRAATETTNEIWYCGVCGKNWEKPGTATGSDMTPEALPGKQSFDF